MEISKNIIKKLTIEVDTSSMAFGLQIKNDIDGFLQQHIYPKIAHYLDQNIPTDELWRYEKINLEIDLDSKESFNEVPAQIISKLGRTFKQQSLHNSKVEIKQITPLSAPKSNIDALIEFLKTGTYPWWFNTENPITITDFASIKNKLLKERIYSEITKTISLNRLIQQFDNQFLNKIYLWHYAESEKRPSQQQITIPILLKSTHKQTFWKAIFSHNKSNVVSFFKELILHLENKKITTNRVHYQLSTEASKKLIELIEFCNKTLKIGVVLSPVKPAKNTFRIGYISEYKKAISANAKIIRDTTDNSEKKGDTKSLKLIVSEDQNESQKTADFTVNSEEKTDAKLPSKTPLKSSKIESEKARKNASESDDNIKSGITNTTSLEDEEMVIDGTIIEKAGLVLLHPFLKHFFINMELLSENKVRPEKRDLAVHLLHYIATKNEQPSEHELVFEKYLCHIPVNTPINRFVELTSEQKKSCDELLQAVLKHWSALRTNSIDALRSEFLLRQGKLTINDERHRLFIQRNTQDILLDTLPWNLHLVKLPWKKQLLYVEW